MAFHCKQESAGLEVLKFRKGKRKKPGYTLAGFKMSSVTTSQELVRENIILEGQAKVREFYFESGKIDILKKIQGKIEVIRLLI